MGLGQTMLTVAFLVLLSFAVVGIYKMVVDKDTSYYEKDAIKQSGLLADALLDEISTKRFDEKADTTWKKWTGTGWDGVQDSLEFNIPNNLGLDRSYWYLINNGMNWHLGQDERGTISLPDTINSRGRFRSFSNADDRYDDVDD